MTRTGTLAFSLLAAIATLVGWAGAAAAQNSTQTSRAGASWEAQSAADRAPQYRRADSSAVTWKPVRTETNREADSSESSDATSTTKDDPKIWLAPGKSASRAQAPVAAKNAGSQTAKVAARVPKPFVPPTDAKLLAAAKRPVTPLAVKPAASNQARANTATSAAQISQSAARVHTQSTEASRQPRNHVAHRPQPIPPRDKELSEGIFDSSWIGPLRQVAFHAGEPEELYAPPGADAEMPSPAGPMMGPEMSDGEWIGAPDGEMCYDGQCGPMCGDGVGCCATCGHQPDDCVCYVDLAPCIHDPVACQEVRFRIPRVNTLMLGGGVHGFKGPFDQARDSGNFGFQENVNMGFKVPLVDFGYQIGYQALQSQLSGDADTGVADAFGQQFLTAGIFRRTPDGFQGGIAWDWLHDERDASANFTQLRAELGFVDCGCHELGTMIAVHLNDEILYDDQREALTTFRAVDQFLLYYRMHGERGGDGRIYAGLTDNSDGLIGADFLLPLTDSWSLQPAFTYLIPDDGAGSVGAREEAWNIGINLVWHWKGQARACHSSPYRPLFNVADNGYMIIDNRP